MSTPIHADIPITGQTVKAATPAVNAPTTNGLIPDIMTAVGDFLGVIIGFLFITVGIFILIQSNAKVQDAQRKVMGAAAALNPDMAGAAIATNVITGKKARAENIQQQMDAPGRHKREAKAAAAEKAKAVVEKAKVAPKVTAKATPVSKFSVPVVETRTVPEQRAARGAAFPTHINSVTPTSPRVERD